MNVIDAIASAAPRKGMNDLHQKVNKYVYEIRMIEIDVTGETFKKFY